MKVSRNLSVPLWVVLLAILALASACAPAAPAPAASQPTAAPAPAATAGEASATGEAASLEGHWEGEIDIMGQKLPIQLDLSGQAGTIDFPTQGAKGIHLENFSAQGDAVHFEVLPAPRTAIFDGNAEGDTISGSFEQAGYKGTFTATRAEVKPQATAEAKEYREEEVTFDNGDVTLAGTLTLPEGAGPHPAVVLISGSGAQNRDEEVFGFKPFAILADHLTKQGIAVLRYDDRGMGGSTTGTADDTSETYASDVQAAVDYLKGRSEIAATQIGLVGHSEGGIIGPIVATQGGDIAFLVLIGSTGVPGKELLPAQVGAIALASGATEEETKAAVALEERVIAAVLTGEGMNQVKSELVEQYRDAAEEMTEEQRKALGDVDAWANRVVQAQLDQMAIPWMTFFLTHDPAATLEKVDVPVLALFGGKDAQVPAEMNETAMKAALAKGGNTDVTTKVFPEANHLFQAAGTGSPNEYTELEPEFLPGFLDTISEWILAQVR